MSDMKCPFCGQKLESFFVENRSVFACCNLNCKGYFMNAPKELWQELIKVIEEKQHKNTTTDQQDEVWKDVVGYEGLYRISNQGTVCRLYKNGKVNFMTPRILNGYWRVKLCNGNTQKEYFLHRLIAQAFIPNPENKPEINHINGIKTDNRIENLEWVTRSENAIHATKTGLLKYSEYRYNRARDINSKPVMCVETRKIYVSCTEAGKDIKTDAAHIGECISGKRSTAGGYHWKLVSIIDAYNSTRKALEIAVDALKRLEKELYFNNAKQTGHIADSVMSIPSIALDKIKALEQKD
jgi:hypothetical protein